MAQSNKMTTRKEFEAHLVAKAWKDPDFRKRLLAAPKAAVQEELGRIHPGASLPDSLEIRVYPETEHEVHLVLPRHPAEAGYAVEPEKLDDVAAGTGAIVVNVGPINTNISNIAVALIC